MVNIKCSEKYTHNALNTFFRNSIFNQQDKFFLIDNDKTFKKDYENVSIVSNSSPKSFAENMNFILKQSIIDGDLLLSGIGKSIIKKGSGLIDICFSVSNVIISEI